MSTMLKSAAMSLLSKTLQTFLSKYLSDVDVEGVALPSMYDGSGWGVRLSNVKLRDGVQLMEKMPGRRIRKRKRNKAEKPVVRPRSTVAERRHRRAASYPEELPEPTKRSSPWKSYDGGGDNEQAEHHVEYEKELRESSLHFYYGDSGDHGPSRSRMNSYDELDVSTRSRIEQPGTTPSSRPATPDQDSKSIFSCFTKGKKTAEKRVSGGMDATANAYDEEDDESLTQPPVSIVQERQLYRQLSSLAMDEKRGTENMGANVGASAREQEEEESESEDEFEEFEEPYRLCVGDNGRIGTLDIRLVDKELHVLVEDALLTIECYPVPEASAAVKDVGVAGPDDAASAATGGTSSQPTPAPPQTKPKAKTEHKRDTVGDRVLADNPLARAIAAIPHLFLRDVRIRFVLRQEPPNSKTNRPEDTTSGAVPVSGQPGPEDTMLEIGIDFLAVSNGDDALSIFQQPQEEAVHYGEGHADSGGLLRSTLTLASSSSMTEKVIDSNEYMVRHIRTGRGSDAGIWVQVFAPTPKLPARTTTSTNDCQVWARQRWAQVTDFHLLRCSGLDVRARIHLGTKKQLSSYSWFFDYDEEYGDYEYDDAAMDSLLVGFDSIAPGMPSLPPINPSMSRGDTPVRVPRTGSFVNSTEDVDALPAMHPGSEKFILDENGIQSCKIPSTFHRISRGLRPGSCKDCLHLPSEACGFCWDGASTIPRVTPLDSSMPLPGLALQVTLRDPLEINVDRPSVETLHLLKTLFVKKRDSTVAVVENTAEPVPVDSKKLGRLDSAATVSTNKSTATRSSFFSFFSSTKTEAEREKNPMESFSPLMQPENIQVLGVHLARIVFRVHLLRENMGDDGLSFSYWDMVASCVTIDQQSLKSEDLVSQDLRFDVGHFVLKEYHGVEETDVAELGALLDSREKSLLSTSKSLNDDHLRNKTPWPSVACALMDIPPPQETLMYKDRRGHGVQLRLIAARKPEDKREIARTMLNVRLGGTTLHAQWGFWKDILSVKRQIISGILGGPSSMPQADVAKESQTPLQATKKPTPTIMAYSVQLDGGAIALPPMIDVKAPMTRLAGELSSESGIFLATVLSNLHMAYGSKAPSNRQGFSIHQLAVLPENIRTRILFCLDDWAPLEDALDVKNKEVKNPFKRTMNINKAITKASKAILPQLPQQVLKKKSVPREEIFANLSKLNDEELNKLWSAHEGLL